MRRIACAILAILASTVFSSAADGPAADLPTVPGAEIARVGFDTLAGWDADDHAAALRTFLKTCPGVVGNGPRMGVAAPRGLAEACREALLEATLGDSRARCVDGSGATTEPAWRGSPLRAGEGQGEGLGLSGEGGTLTPSLSRTGEGAASRLPRSSSAELCQTAARGFFERRFSAVEIRPAGSRGFLTGYYEPEFPGSPAPTPDFTAPLLALPDDFAAAQQSADGKPYPDRAAIEDGALGDRARPLVWLRDAVAVFIVQVQGSARIRLPDGRAMRVAYAGRNGHPYTSVARLLVGRLWIAPADMTADRLTEWLRANPIEARDLLRQNRSYVFFRIADELAPGDGPVGAAAIPLTAGRSLAVDAGIWPYGLPVWIEGGFSDPPGGGVAPGGRLVVAQDTGAAITGPARGDLFVGSGEEAGLRAGLIRAGLRFVVLWPKPGTSR